MNYETNNTQRVMSLENALPIGGGLLLVGSGIAYMVYKASDSHDQAAAIRRTSSHAGQYANAGVAYVPSNFTVNTGVIADGLGTAGASLLLIAGAETLYRTMVRSHEAPLPQPPAAKVTMTGEHRAVSGKKKLLGIF